MGQSIDSTITRHQAKLFCMFTMCLIAVFIIKHSNDNTSYRNSMTKYTVDLLLSVFALSISRSCFKNLAYYYKVYIFRDISKSQYN